MQALWITLGVLCLPAGLLAVVLRLIRPISDGPAMLASFIPYGIAATALVSGFWLIAFLRARRRGMLGFITSLAALLLVLQVAWIAPLYVPDNRPATTDTFTVMSLNLLAGQADTGQVVEQAGQADVAVLLEYTPDAASRLQAAGWDAMFPYSVGDPRDGLSGSAIYSRFPLSDPQSLGRTSFQQWRATAEVPAIGPVTIFGVHPCNPLCGGNAWQSEHELLRRLCKPFLDSELIMAGDFNAVDDHAPIRDLVSDGMATATDLAGAGWLPTYPAGDRPKTPLIAIDHVLV